MGPGVRRDDGSFCIGRNAMNSHLRPGIIAAIAALALDQASKLWLLFVFDIGHRGAVGVTGHSLLGAILVLRSFEVLGVVLIAASLPTLARSVGKDPARAIWLGVCNPLVLFHFIGGAHNDALMIGLLTAGLAVATKQRYLAGVVLCALAATVKNPAALGIAFIALEAVRNAPPERRLAVFARLSGATAATFGLVAVAAHLLTPLDWTQSLLLGAVLSPTDPAAVFAAVSRAGAGAAVSSAPTADVGAGDTEERSRHDDEGSGQGPDRSSQRQDGAGHVQGWFTDRRTPGARAACRSAKRSPGPADPGRAGFAREAVRHQHGTARRAAEACRQRQGWRVS